MTTDVVDAPWRKVTLEELRAHRDEIEEIGRRYGVSNIHVFDPLGSDHVSRLLHR